MTLAKDFEDFIQLLNNYEVEYLVVGGYAMAFHGKPRYTGDLDIWINISATNAEKMLRVMKDFGMDALGFEKDDFLQPGYISQIGYPPLRIDILNSIDGVLFDEAYENRQKVKADDLDILYIGLNDLLKNKKASGRKQNIADVKEIKKAIDSKIRKGK